ncbi:hypothetical protein [Streptomyces sp. NPDC093589]|uniref:hypothetical protein n=1 Tax=Streptomyces sp. NPDC093589 TaxID=3366043 RepID=UPI003800888E
MPPSREPLLVPDLPLQQGVLLRHRTTAVLSLATLSLALLPGCSTSSSPASAKASSAQHGSGKPTPQPSRTMSATALHGRLLSASDLGEGYSLKPETSSGHDDVTVTGCPALEKLGGDAAAGGSLTFPNKAKVSYSYAGSTGSEVSEELYSDTEAKLSTGLNRIFKAMTSCPTYQVVVGGTPVEMATRKLPAPRLGDEQWSQQLSFTAGGRTTVAKQTAIRTGTVLVVVSGSPGLVDAHIAKASRKAQAAR